MAIKYAVQQISRKGVTPGSTETKYYAQARYDGVTSQADIAQMVAQISAISVGDVLSVMNTVSMLLSIELANGRIVELGDLGRFRATLRSKSCDKPEEFKREMIHGNRVIFVPGPQIRHKMTSIQPISRPHPTWQRNGRRFRLADAPNRRQHGRQL